MPLSPEERVSVLDQVVSILTVDVADELHTFYAEVVAAAEKHPEQANKELRDAVTHLGRALVAEEYSRALSQIEQAKGHVERAKRECLKMALVFADDRLRRLCHEVRLEHGRVGANYLRRRRELRVTRREIFRSESQGSNDITLRLLGLVNSFAELEDDLITDYSMPDKRLRWYRMPSRYILSFWRRFIWPILFGILIGVVGILVAALLVPNLDDFGRSGREAIANFMRDHLPHTAVRPPGVNPPSHPPG